MVFFADDALHGLGVDGEAAVERVVVAEGVGVELDGCLERVDGVVVFFVLRHGFFCEEYDVDHACEHADAHGVSPQP